MRLVAIRGYAYKQAALELGISVSTVRSHAHTAYRVLGVNRAADAVLRMQELGWLVKPKPPVEPVEEGPLPPAIKAYLRVFDRYLRVWARGTAEEEQRARLECRYMLGGIYVEQGLSREAA